MIKTLATIMGLIMVIPSPVSPLISSRAIVGRIEGNSAVVEFSNNTTIKRIDIPVEDINRNVAQGMELPVIAVEGNSTAICYV